MKKLIPIIIAIALICVVVLTSFGKQVYDKYSYGDEKADLNEYFEKYSEDRVPIILQDARISETAKLIGDELYLERNTVKKYLTERFYVDRNEGLLLYTNGEGTIRNEIGSDSYTERGESVSLGFPLCVIEDEEEYISMTYLRKFVNFSYELFANPDHIQMYTEWGEKKVANITGDTNVRWKGGVKSPILTPVEKGAVVEILEPMDDWTKIKTSDAYIGYVENKFLEDERFENETPVNDVPLENFISLTKDYKINLVWHSIEYPQDGQTLYGDCAKIKEVNVISPTWYWLTDNDGNIKSVASESYVTAAGKMGMEVWPLVSNFHSGVDVDTGEVLSYTSKREYLINELITETLKYGAHGINVDFENIESAYAESYVQFIRELSLACHANNLIVSVDNYVPSEYTAHYNRKEQGLFADYIIIMGYDEHYVGSDAGSVAGMQWMSNGIKDTVSVVPANKVINAVPFYTRIWKTSGDTTTSEAVDMATANEFVKNHKLELTWDEENGQNYGEVTFDGIFWQVWMEDTDSLKVRLNVMNSYGIAGIAAWRLGMETTDVWDYIENYMKE